MITIVRSVGELDSGHASRPEREDAGAPPPTSSCDSDWNQQVRRVIGTVYRPHPDLEDHRSRFPWLDGFLGDPNSPVWFVAWYPSTTAVASINSKASTCEDQWRATKGDQLFRQNLCSHGFRSGKLNDPGGWRCYITDIVKADSVPKDFDKLQRAERERLYETWLPVLEWEFAHGKPALVVSVGNAVSRYLDELSPRLVSARGKSMQRAHVMHYAFFTRGEDSPSNRTRYAKEFEAVESALT